MKHNEAGCDRAVRVVLGLALLSLTIVGPQTWLGLVGLIPLVTGLWGVCPLYRVFGVNTCPVQSKRHKGGAPEHARGPVSLAAGAARKE